MNYSYKSMIFIFLPKHVTTSSGDCMRFLTHNYVRSTEVYIYGSVYPPLVNAILSRSRENYRAIRDN